MHRLGIAKRGAELCSNSERYPNVWRNQRARAAESLRRNADHVIRLAVDLKRAPDEIVASAHPFPKSIARDHHRDIGVRPRFLGAVKSSQKRFTYNQREQLF